MGQIHLPILSSATDGKNWQYRKRLRPPPPSRKTTNGSIHWKILRQATHSTDLMDWTNQSVGIDANGSLFTNTLTHLASDWTATSGDNASSISCSTNGQQKGEKKEERWSSAIISLLHSIVYFRYERSELEKQVKRCSNGSSLSRIVQHTLNEIYRLCHWPTTRRRRHLRQNSCRFMTDTWPVELTSEYGCMLIILSPYPFNYTSGWSVPRCWVYSWLFLLCFLPFETSCVLFFPSFAAVLTPMKAKLPTYSPCYSETSSPSSSTFRSPSSTNGFDRVATPVE